ncbi:hypothetical protein BKA56DRAFT_273467 [Ilyonectria sp. MPI-CAGE-AT-0026]|nr:hypothetical protein BKA56DRAFT_273467 [Ilyonectria sp. MPI-CAGE-AT-0026]
MPIPPFALPCSVSRIRLVILSLLLRFAASLRHHARAPAWFPALWYLSTEGCICFELIPPPSPLAVYFSCLVCARRLTHTPLTPSHPSHTPDPRLLISTFVSYLFSLLVYSAVSCHEEIEHREDTHTQETGKLENADGALFTPGHDYNPPPLPPQTIRGCRPSAVAGHCDCMGMSLASSLP